VSVSTGASLEDQAGSIIVRVGSSASDPGGDLDLCAGSNRGELRLTSDAGRGAPRP
jgi:hypothetical protein